MLTVRLEPDQERALADLARETGRSKSYYVRQALGQYLEDRADYLLALVALERDDETLPVDEVRRQLGL